MNNDIFDLSIFSEFDINDIITESTFDIEDYIFNEAEEVKKKNIIQKLWGMIKKVVSVIAAKFREITNAFVSIFKTKKVTDKTLDQIAEYVLGISEKEPGTKHLRFRYDDDQRITINYLANTVKKFIKEPKIVGHSKKDRPQQNAILLIFHIVKKPDLLDPIIEILEGIKNNNGEVSDYARLKKAIDAVWAGLTMGFSCTITLEQWTNLNERIIRLNKAMEVIDSDTFGAVTVHANKTDFSNNAHLANLLNELIDITALLQVGINYIGDGMRQVYELDGAYHNKIDINNYLQKLPLFVKMCVESNIPSKYIYYATHHICDISINSNVSDPTKKDDIPKPLNGNSRYVMFPSDPNLNGKIIKVAYNGLGTRSNRNEFEVWDRVKDIPEIAQELYHVYDIGDKDFYIILTDRATPVDNYEKSNEWNENMKKMCLEKNVGFIIRCNPNGFGKIGDKVVCIDYGTVYRV